MINVLNAGNLKVSDGLMITVLSMIKHTTEPINMICFTMDLSDVDKRFVPLSKEFSTLVDKTLKSKNPESKFTLIDMTEHFKSELINSKNLKTGFTPYTMLRLLADKTDMPERFIYLDTDTVINRDLSLLYNEDLNGCEIGVVRDAYRISKKYFNAGVMLIDYKKCLESKLFERARVLVNNKKMLYVDQAALNICCKNKLMLPLVYNSKSKYYPEIVVHHFCDVRKHFFHRIKPWEVDLVKEKMSAYNDVLDEYLELKQKYPTLFFR